MDTQLINSLSSLFANTDKSKFSKISKYLIIIFALIVLPLAVFLVQQVQNLIKRAAENTVVIETEVGSVISPATIVDDSTASGGKYIQFSTGTGDVASYYVDCVGGNDANNGASQDTAWKTLTKASSASIKPGESLLLKRGCTFNGTLTMSESGTATNNIKIGAYGLGTDLPIIKNNTNNSQDVTVSGSYLTFENIRVSADAPSLETGCENNPKGHIVGFGFESGASNNTVRNCSADSLYAGVYIKSGASNNRILNSTFQNNLMMSPLDTTSNNDAGAFGVLLWGNNNEIAFNSFSGQNACSYDYIRDGSAIEVYNGSGNKVHHNISNENDTFTELGKDSSHSSADNVFAYNKITSSITGSIFFNTRGSGNTFGPVYRTKVYNNSVYLTGATSQGVICSNCGPDILTLKNNIIWANNKSVYAAPCDEGNNIYWKTGGNPSIQGGLVIASTSKTVDPKYLNTGSLDLHLQSGSPAINSGTSESIAIGFTTDLENKTVPNGAAVDAGGYEF